MFENKNTIAKIIAVCLVLLLLLAKWVNSSVQQWKVLDAILLYKMDCIEDGRACIVEYDDTESLGDTFWRLWDWSDKRIVDAEKYALIKPYLGQKAGWRP